MAFLSGASRGTVDDATKAKREVADQLFAAQVVQPWLALTFGGNRHCVDTDHPDADGCPLPVAPQDADRNMCRDHMRSRDGHGGYAPRFLRLPAGSDERDAEHEAIKSGQAPDGDRQFDGHQVDKADAPPVDIQQAGGPYRPSAVARAEIPARYLRLYQQAGHEHGIDPWILAAIGSIESNHGRSAQAGVRPGVNFAGCCAGPMQFNIRNGPPSTWDGYGVDGDHDGRTSPYDPADAIPAAARYLRASGAPRDYQRALLAYNNAQWYVDQVLAKAAEYRARPAAAMLPALRASIRRLLNDRDLALTPLQRADLGQGGYDPRLINTLAAIAARHTVVITALRADHHPGANHEAGRAFDIGAVDGEICRGARSGPCAPLVRQLARVTGPARSTELIYCGDPDGPARLRPV